MTDVKYTPLLQEMVNSTCVFKSMANMCTSSSIAISLNIMSSL